MTSTQRRNSHHAWVNLRNIRRVSKYFVQLWDHIDREDNAAADSNTTNDCGDSAIIQAIFFHEGREPEAEKHTESEEKDSSDDPGPDVLVSDAGQEIAWDGAFEDVAFGGGGVGSNAEVAVFHVVDGVVTTEEGVPKEEKVLLVSDDGQGTQRHVLLGAGVEDEVTHAHLVPAAIEHEVKCAQLALLSAREG